MKKTTTFAAAALAAVTMAASSAWAASVKLQTPTIDCYASAAETITISVTAPCSPQSGRAGLSIQWMTCDDFAANGNQWYSSDDPRLCKASLSGVANGSDWSFAPCETKYIMVGALDDADPGVSFNCNKLECGTCYIFRAFFHQEPKGKFSDPGSKSDFSADLTCNTADCGGGNCEACSYSKGCFTSAGNCPGKDAAAGCFPITVGGVTYNSIADVVAIPTSQNLRGQVVALYLNVCINGVDSCYANTIACDVDGAAFNGLALSPAQQQALAGQTIWDVAQALSAYLATGPNSVVGPYGLLNAPGTHSDELKNVQAGGQMSNLASGLNILYENCVLATGLGSRLCADIPPVP